MPLHSEAFSYYDRDGCYRTVQAGSVDPAAVPFVVRIRKQGYIPCNVIVFAMDSAEAVRRVLEAVDETCRMIWRNRRPMRAGERGYRAHGRARIFNIRKGLKLGQYRVQVESFDRCSISKIQWASNDGVC